MTDLQALTGGLVLLAVLCLMLWHDAGAGVCCICGRKCDDHCNVCGTHRI